MIRTTRALAPSSAATLGAACAVFLSTTSLARAQTPPVAVDDVYSVATGGELVAVAPPAAAVIEELIDATGDGVHALTGVEGIAVDVAGNVFVAGLNTDNVFRVTPGGVVTQVLDATGDGVAGFAAPFGVATDAAGNLFAAGSGTDNVFRVEPGGTITQVIDATGDGAVPLLSPFGVATDSAGNLYVSGKDSWNVFRVTPGGVITEIIDFTGDGVSPLQEPFGVAVDAADNVYVAGRKSDNVFKITPGGTITEILDAAGDGLGNTLDCGNFVHCGITAAADGTVYVTGGQSDNVFRVDSGGAVTEILDAAGGGAGSLDLPQGVAFDDGSGTLFVAGTLSSNVFAVTAALDVSIVLDSSGDGMGNPYDTPDAFNLAVDAAGNLYASAFTSANAFKVPPGGPPPTAGITQLIDGSGDGVSALVNPDGIDVDEAGNLYVGGCGNSPANSSVFRIDAGGAITEVLDGTGDGVHAFNCPVGTELDCKGNLWVAGHRSDNVFRVAPDGVVTMMADAADGLLAPFDVAIDGRDNVYVTGFDSDNVVRIAPDGTVTEVMDATGDGLGQTLDAPFGVDVDADGNVYVAGNDGDNAFRVAPGGAVTAIITAAGDGVNAFAKCADVAVARSGNVYVTGNGSDNVFRVAPGGAITMIASAADGLDNPTGIEVDAAENVYVCCFESDNVFCIRPDGAIVEVLTGAGDGAHGFEGPADDCIALAGDGTVYVTGTLAFHNVFRVELDRPGVLDNDADVDGDPLTAALVSPPTAGALTLDPDGSFTYQHDGGSALVDSFTYRANDGGFDSNTATVTIAIEPACPPSFDDLGWSMCFGDGSAAACPCGNESGVAQSGCEHSGGEGARIRAHGSDQVVVDDAVFSLCRAVPNQTAVLVQGAAAIALPFKDGVLCMGSWTRRIEFVAVGPDGGATTTASLATRGNLFPGQTRYYQWWFRDPGASPCGSGSNFSSGLSVDWM